MSGLDSESESDVLDGPEPEDDLPETLYVHSPEDEFGAVCIYIYCQTIMVFVNNVNILGWRTS